jgi:hypothetical protein
MTTGPGVMEDPSFSLPARRYAGRSVNRLWNLSLMLLILFVLLTLTIPPLVKDAMPNTLMPINRSLPGSRVGVLTQAQGAVLKIDRTTYTLAPLALIEDKFGTAVMLSDLRFTDVEFDVQYWLGTDLGPNHILQLVVSFPE